LGEGRKNQSKERGCQTETSENFWRFGRNRWKEGGKSMGRMRKTDGSRRIACKNQVYLEATSTVNRKNDQGDVKKGRRFKWEKAKP
jgi:hypothetical protein